MRALLLWLLLVVWMAGLWAQGPPAAPKVPGALDSVSRSDSPSPPVAKPPPQDPMSAAREKQQAAAARQRQAVRKQAEGVGAWMNGNVRVLVRARRADLRKDGVCGDQVTPGIHDALRQRSHDVRVEFAIGDKIKWDAKRGQIFIRDRRRAAKRAFWQLIALVCLC